MPTLASLDANGASATWSGPAQLDWVAVFHNSGSMSYSSGLCINQPHSSPFVLPASAYPTSDTYVFGVERINTSTAITGGSGVYYVYNLDQIYVSK